MVIKPMSRVLLGKFERIKHAFNGKGDAQLTLSRGTKVVAGYEDSITNGVLTLTEYVKNIAKSKFGTLLILSRQDLKDMFFKSVDGTLRLLQKQLTRVSNLKHKGLPCRVTVNAPS